MTKIKLFFWISLSVSLTAVSMLLTTCTDDAPLNDPKPVKRIVPVEIAGPKQNANYVVGDVVELKIKINAPSEIKNLQLFVNDTLFADKLKVESQTIQIPTTNGKVGWVDFYLAYQDKSNNPHRDYRRLVFFSDEIPEGKFVNIVNTYPHNTISYTQGLEFYKGKLFESTGQKGYSILAEVDLNTGDQLRKTPLDQQYFGEGITILNDTIYQITWQSNVCMLYDLDFNKIGELYYDGEGWGLTNDGTSIIMTNGSSEIVWRNPRTFNVEKQIYAFEPETDVVNLNELELINGNLFINVYTENRIIEVDTLTGKVLTSINCFELSEKGTQIGSDVLNGIAFNKETGKIYMTGKMWPKLFEVNFKE